MLPVIIPVILALLLGPGVGQLYNKEFKKGFILIAFSIGLLVAFSVWLTKAAIVYLPPDLTNIDRNTLRDVIQTHIIPDHSGTFYTYEVLLSILWLYGVIDAYLGAMRRRALRQVPPAPSSSSSSGG